MSETAGKCDTACPSWCRLPAGHVAGPRDTGEIIHSRLVREIYLGEIDAIRDMADRPVRVEVEAFADPGGQEHAPTIRLTLSSASSPDPGADDLTPAEAEVLGAALLEAVRLARS